MKILEIIFIILTFILLITNVLIKNKKYKMVSNPLFYVFLIIESFLILFDKVTILDTSSIFYLIFNFLAVFSFASNDIINIKLKESDNKKKIIIVLDYLYPILMIIGISICYGFSFITILLLFVFALLYYLFNYLFKVNNKISINNVLSTLIYSYFVSSSLSIMIFSSGNTEDFFTGLFLLIGSLFYLLSMLVLEKENILSEKFKSLVFISKILRKVSIIFVLFSSFFIF